MGHDECVSRVITDHSATGSPFSRHARALYCFSKSAYHSGIGPGDRPRPAAMMALPSSSTCSIGTL